MKTLIVQSEAFKPHGQLCVTDQEVKVHSSLLTLRLSQIARARKMPGVTRKKLEECGFQISQEACKGLLTNSHVTYYRQMGHMPAHYREHFQECEVCQKMLSDEESEA